MLRSVTRDTCGSPGDDPARGVVLIERVAQLLPSSLQLLSESEAVQHHRIPLVLDK